MSFASIIIAYTLVYFSFLFNLGYLCVSFFQEVILSSISFPTSSPAVSGSLFKDILIFLIFASVPDILTCANNFKSDFFIASLHILLYIRKCHLIFLQIFKNHHLLRIPHPFLFVLQVLEVIVCSG